MYFRDRGSNSIIIPIRKSCDIEEPTNFRPLIYFLSHQKYFGKVISTQLTEYLKNFCLFNENQCAYRNNSSTEQALINVTEQI